MGTNILTAPAAGRGMDVHLVFICVILFHGSTPLLDILIITHLRGKIKIFTRQNYDSDTAA
jgi:hypothetical protein